MLRLLMPPLVVLPLVVLVACGEDEVACTTMAASSATVHVVNADGTTPLAAEVTATDADGKPVQTECVGGTDTAGDCSEWIVGWEVAGEIQINAEAYNGCNYGYGEANIDVQMDDVGCHVVSQEVTLTVGEWTDLGCP